MTSQKPLSEGRKKKAKMMLPSEKWVQMSAVRETPSLLGDWGCTGPVQCSGLYTTSADTGSTPPPGCPGDARACRELCITWLPWPGEGLGSRLGWFGGSLCRRVKVISQIEVCRREGIVNSCLWQQHEAVGTHPTLWVLCMSCCTIARGSHLRLELERASSHSAAQS